MSNAVVALVSEKWYKSASGKFCREVGGSNQQTYTTILSAYKAMFKSIEKSCCGMFVCYEGLTHVFHSAGGDTTSMRVNGLSLLETLEPADEQGNYDYIYIAYPTP